MNFLKKLALYGLTATMLSGISFGKANPKVIEASPSKLETIVSKPLSKQKDNMAFSIGATAGLYNIAAEDFEHYYDTKSGSCFGVDGEVNINFPFNITAGFRKFNKSREYLTWSQNWLKVGGRYYITTGIKKVYPFISLEIAYVNLKEEHDVFGGYESSAFGFVSSGGIKYLLHDNISLSLGAEHLSTKIEGEEGIVLNAGGWFVGANLSFSFPKK